MAWEVIDDLLDLHEKWAGGIKLVPTSAYGVRLYQNSSSLIMHHDKVMTDLLLKNKFVVCISRLYKIALTFIQSHLLTSSEHPLFITIFTQFQ